MIVAGKSPKVWQAASWILSLIVAAVAAHEGTRAVTQPPAPIVQQKPAEPATVKQEPMSVDLLVAAAKDRPGLIDEFERGARKLAADARAKLARKD